MGCTESRESVRVRDKYAAKLQEPRVIAAMETLRVDRRDAGLRLYRLFVAIDVDDSDSIDMSEFLSHLGLHRSPFAEQVFSNLDFMLNLWSFCTMGRQDLFDHVFKIYDDDGNGVLDTAEVESLLRFIYQTETLSPKILAMLETADANHDRLISKDEFFVLCATNRHLLAPVFELQARARAKCFGQTFWSKESKKRPAILGSMDDVFAAFNKRLSDSASSTNRLLVNSQQPSETVQPEAGGEKQLSTEVTRFANDHHPAASERIAQRQQARELQILLDWVETHRKDPTVDEYLVAHGQKVAVDKSLEERKRDKSTAVELLTQLRHRAAVSNKKLDAARAALQARWGAEERALIDKRHMAIKSMVKGVSAKTLLQQTSKSGAGAAIGDYLQKKLDNAETDVRQEFRKRWETLERAANYLAANSQQLSEDMPLTSASSNQAATKLTFASEDAGGSKKTAAEHTKVVPIAEEIWTECFDAGSQCVYYVSSLGASSWDPPPGYQRQW